KPENASVFDSYWTRIARLLGRAIGAADPASQVLARATPTEVPGNRTLDLSHAARMKRAAEQGFDVNRRLYHGTSSDFPEFRVGRRQLYLTDDPQIADIYAMTERGGLTPNAGPNVIPVYAKAKKPLVISDLGPDGGNGWSSDNLAAVLGVDNPGTGTKLIDEARRQGYDLIEGRDMSDLGGRQSQFIPLQPSNVRSVHAKFDPRNRESANLLASLAGLGLIPLSQVGQPRTEKR